MSSKSDINRFSKLRLSRSRWLQHLKFLLRCRNNKLIPNFIRVKCNLPLNGKISKVIRNCHFALLRAVIKNTRSNISRIELELYNLHLKLSTEVPSFFNIDHKSSIHVTNETSKHKECLKRKYDNLHKKSNITRSSSSAPFKPVVNLSSCTLTTAQEKALSLNSNFAITTHIQEHKIIAPIEKSFKHSKLDPRQKESLRYEISKLLLENKDKKIIPNLTVQERKDISTLRSNSNIVITKADKGGQIVIMDKEKYKEGVQKLIDEGPYQKLKKDPTSSLTNNVKKSVKNCQTLDEYTKKSLIPSFSNCSRFYALPKVHKKDIPLRPIVSNIGSTTYLLSKYLVNRFSSLLSSNKHTVKNSFNFTEKLKQIPYKDFTMASFDVKSLFTSVPIIGALDCLYLRMRAFHFANQEIDELLHLTKTCIQNTYFQVNEQYFKQTDGLAMGNPLSPILADLYMHYFEEKLFSVIQFHAWIRYVDDTFVLMDPISNLSQILDQINSIDPHIQFTVEMEKNNSIPFLDVLITRTTTGFQTSVYRKPFTATLPPHRRSAHPYSQKMSAFFYFVNRAIHLCSTEDLLKKELNYLRNIAQYRGYRTTIIDQAFIKLTRQRPATSLTPIIEPQYTTSIILPYSTPSCHRIATILRRHQFKIIFTPINKLTFSQLKDPIPDFNSWGIYKIPCQCNLFYIGQTRRSLHFRLKEHQNYIKKQEFNKSSMAVHCVQYQHNFKFSEAKIICRTHSIHELDFLEAFFIHRFSQNLVNDISSTPYCSQAWMEIIRQ